MNRALLVLSILVGTFVACGAFDAESQPPASTVDGGGGSEAGPDVGDEGGAPPDAGGITDADAAPTFADLVKQIPGLVGYWHLDEGGGSPPADVVGGNQGTWQPTVAPAQGLLPGDGPSSATSFTTGALSISSGDLSSLRTFDKALTVGALVRVANLKTQETVVFKYGMFGFGVLGDATVFLDVQRGGSLVRFQSTHKVSVEKTALIVGAFDLANGGRVSVWVNGQLTTAAGEAGLTTGAAANTENLCIGGSTTTAGATDCRSAVAFPGTIDEVFIANQAVMMPALVEKLTQAAGF